MTTNYTQKHQQTSIVSHSFSIKRSEINFEVCKQLCVHCALCNNNNLQIRVRQKLNFFWQFFLQMRHAELCVWRGWYRSHIASHLLGLMKMHAVQTAGDRKLRMSTHCEKSKCGPWCAAAVVSAGGGGAVTYNNEKTQLILIIKKSIISSGRNAD